MSKIVAKSNHDLETVDDWLVCENITNHMGQKVVDFLNQGATNSSPTWYVLKPDDYELYKWEP